MRCFRAARLEVGLGGVSLRTGIGKGKGGARRARSMVC